MKKNLPKIILVTGVLGLTASLRYMLSLFSQKPENTNPESIITTTSSNPQTTTNQTSQNSLQNTTETTTKQTAITILMPGFFFNDDFISFANDLQTEKNIDIKFQTIQKLSDYQILLSDPTNISADIILMPTYRINSFDANTLKYIDLWEQWGISPYFLPIFQHLTESKSFNFIPFSIDPLVTFVSDIQFKEKKVSIGSLLTYLNLSTASNQLHMPLLRGFGKNDIRLLEQNWESFPHYFTFLYNIIYQYSQDNNHQWLTQLQDINTSIMPHKRNFIKYKQILKKIEKRNPNCLDFPGICLFVYKFGNIKFGFISDLAIWDQYFTETTLTSAHIKIKNFPLITDVYKVNSRGFVINKKNNQDAITKTFFQEYLKAWVQNKYSLRNKHLSAFTNIFATQSSQKKYQELLKYQKQFSLIYNHLDTQKQFLSQTQTINLLQNKISAEEYLNSLNRTR